METSRSALLVLLIASFIILPIVMPFVISIMQKYDDKVRESAEKPGKEFGLKNVFLRTIIYSITIAAFHGIYLLKIPMGYAYTAGLVVGVYLLLIAPSFLFATVFIVDFLFHCANIFFNLDPNSTPIMPVAPSVAMIMLMPIFFSHNKLYNIFYVWKSTFSISPNEAKKIMYQLRDTDFRVPDKYFYTDTNQYDNLNPEAVLFYKMEPYIKNMNAPTFYGASDSDALTLADRIRGIVTEIDRRFIRGKRDFIYFFIALGIVYLLNFVVFRFSRVF